MAKKEEELQKTYAIDNSEIIEKEEESYPEPEIIKTIDITEEENKKDKKNKKKKKNKKEKNTAKLIINIVFTVIMVIMALIVLDVVLITKFNVGPFFALPIKTYDDGGTKEYYGIGYKVIKYQQKQGRRDLEIGTWSLKYNTEPITFEDLDLAIEMKGNEDITFQKYNKKFVRIISTLEKVDTKKHQITIGYKDEDKKYSLNIVCDIVKEQTNLSKLEKGKEITVIGILDGYKNNKVSELHISNCFAEQ